MKTAFRMLLSTLAAAGVLYVLYRAHGYFAVHSMLGDTVERVTGLCFQLLTALTLVLYARCWLSLAVDGVRALVRRLRRRKHPQLHIKTDEHARLYDRETAEETADTQVEASL